MLMSNITGILKKVSLSQVGKLPKLNLHCTPALSIKEYVVKEEGNNKVIEGVLKESPRKDQLIKTEHDEHACPVCRLNLDIKHTDVMILSQFVRKDGCMLPRRVTGLCKLSQKKMSTLVSMAHVAGLMPSLVPSYSKPNCQRRRREWRKYNTYFDENTIKFYDTFNNKRNTPLKVQYYKKLGVTWDEEPWKNRYQVDVQTKKLKYVT